MSVRRVTLAGALVLSLVACGQKEAPQLSRVEAVKSSGNGLTPERWCDVFYPPSSAPTLSLPNVVPARAGQAVGALPTDRWVWVNLWATWCGPCKREMPLLIRWIDQLRSDGANPDLWFVSVDQSGDELTRFLQANPEMAPGNSVRLASYSDLGGWLRSFPGAPDNMVPIQIIAAPGLKVRCVRSGSLRDGDYPVVKALIR